MKEAPKLPKKKARKTITVAIDITLLDEVKKTASQRGLTMRDAVHFGLEQFLWAARRDSKNNE